MCEPRKARHALQYHRLSTLVVELHVTSCLDCVAEAKALHVLPTLRGYLGAVRESRMGSFVYALEYGPSMWMT